MKEIEAQISRLEDSAMKNTQTEKKKRIKRSEDNLRDL